jgi:hypothetical protein
MVATGELRDRLETGRRALMGLRAAVEARRPWPLSEAFGTEPEAHWGPPEVLAHVAEMLRFWQGEIARVVDGPEEPVPFGRVATDRLRIGILERDRSLPTRELFERIDVDVDRFVRLLAALGPGEAARRGLHPRLGEMTVGQIAERFVVSHLEEHVRQLAETLAAAGPTGG